MKTWLNEIDTLIRQGRSQLARARIDEFLKSSIREGKSGKWAIPRAHLAEVAALCRRSGSSLDSIRILGPFVRPKGRKFAEASETERLEYGAALVSIGAEREGSAILSTIDPARHPSVLLFKSFASMGRWDYEEALPFLRAYAKVPQLTPYQRDIARVNLALTLVALDHNEEANELLAALIDHLKEQKSFFLYGSVLTSLAQVRIYSGQWAAAKKTLLEASNVMELVGSFDRIYIDKWRAVLEVRKTGANEPSVEQLQAVRTLALERGNWETVRDCDYHLVVAKKDVSLASYLFFGTPFPAYRRRLTAESGVTFAPDATYEWIMKSARNPGPRIDTLTGRCGNGPARLKPGQIQHRLLRTLSADFYKPARLPELFSHLFPDRYYNPISAPNVIHQAIHRMRAWFDENRMPLEIIESDSHYHLTALSACSLVIHQSPIEELRLDAGIARLKANYSNQDRLSRVQIAKALGISDRSANRFVSLARENGMLTSSGSGPATRYGLSS